MTISVKFLNKAIVTLEEVLKLEENDIVRDSAIQRFEYTYELAVKLIRKSLIEILSSDEVNSTSFKNMIRLAADKGIIDDPIKWFKYRECRNKSSHAYNEEIADEVYSALPEFLKSVKIVVKNIDELGE